MVLLSTPSDENSPLKYIVYITVCMRACVLGEAKYLFLSFVNSVLVSEHSDTSERKPNPSENKQQQKVC